jgi:hypothetical protein
MRSRQDVLYARPVRVFFQKVQDDMRIKTLAAAAVLGVSALALSGCATGFPTQVSRYQAMPAPQGQTFFVVSDNPQKAGGLEFTHFASMVAQGLQAQGYTPAANPQSATMIVHFNYGVDRGHVELFPTMYGDPFFNRSPGSLYYSRWGPYGRPYYGWNDPFFYGWNDPFYPGYGSGGYERQTVYQSFVDLDIRRKGDNAGLFEGHAKAKSTGNNLGKLVPALVTAMFTNFPGQSGETVKIVVPTSRPVAPR